MKKYALALCLALVAFVALVAFAPSAYAALPKVPQYQARVGGSFFIGSPSSSQSGACSNASAWTMANSSARGGTSWDGGTCHILNTSGGNSGFTVDIVPLGSGCPENSTDAGASCTCNAGYVEQGGQCKNPNEACQAKSGTSEIINVTSGWARGPKPGADWAITNKITNSSGVGSVCNSGCTQTFDVSEPCPECDGYISQVPNSQGLYRTSIDFRGHYSGAACTAGPDDALTRPDDTQDPPCPGYVGEVNGVKGCYGTAEKPVRPVPPDPALDKPDRKPGNPSAGPKPTDGPGSGSGGAGRTPGTGNGGSQGGPAGAAGTGSGDGTTDKPDDGKEQQNCGAPGQPPCKIDETGTPNGSAQVQGLGGLKDAIKTFGDKAGQDIDKAKGLTSDGWTFTFALPTGCTPFVVEPLQVTLDVCQWQGIIHDLLTMVWLAVTVWCCIGMVGRTLQN